VICCNGTDGETLKRIAALHDEQYPGVNSSCSRLQACFLKVGKKGSVVNYFMHDFDVLRAAKPQGAHTPRSRVWDKSGPLTSRRPLPPSGSVLTHRRRDPCQDKR